MKAVVVAPYSGVGSSRSPQPAAALKILALIRILRRSGLDVQLVNYAHNYDGWRLMQYKERETCGWKYSEILFPSARRAKFSKLIGLAFVAWLAAKKGSIPQLVWSYNCYIHGALYCVIAKFIFGQRYILQIEDWPTARKGGWLTVRGAIEYLLLLLVARNAALVTCVNEAIAGKIAGFGVPTLIWEGMAPSIRENWPSKIGVIKSDSITIGYFGQLSVEKGVDKLMLLVDKLGAQYKFIVVGSGPLAVQFGSLAEGAVGRVKLYSNIDEEEKVRLMSMCDILVNLHVDTSKMNEGVFPYKVIEYLAAGCVVVSTKLPSSRIPFGRSVLFCGYSFEEIQASIEEATKNIAVYREAAVDLRKWVLANYSEKSVGDSIGFWLGPILAELSSEVENLKIL